MIWKKRKQIVLDFFTYSKIIYEIAAVDHLKNCKPDWWKKLDSTKHNMSGCVGLNNTYENGFYIPIWSDLKMEISSDNFSYSIPTNESLKLVHHSKDEWGNFIDNKKHHHIKLITPWLVHTKSKIKFLYTGATWNGIGLNDTVGLNVLTGVVDFYYQHSLNVNIMLHKTKEITKYDFKIGQPLVYVIPLCEDNIEIKTHLVSRQEFANKSGNPGNYIFNKAYYKYKKLKDKNECKFN